MWFYFDGSDVIVYSMPNAAKVRHIKNHPRVSLNLDSDGNGAGIIVVGGEARVDAVDVDGRADGPFWASTRRTPSSSGSPRLLRRTTPA